jgi:hypothetical protein
MCPGLPAQRRIFLQYQWATHRMTTEIPARSVNLRAGDTRRASHPCACAAPARPSFSRGVRVSIGRIATAERQKKGGERTSPPPFIWPPRRYRKTCLPASSFIKQPSGIGTDFMRECAALMFKQFGAGAAGGSEANADRTAEKAQRSWRLKGPRPKRPSRRSQPWQTGSTRWRLNSPSSRGGTGFSGWPERVGREANYTRRRCVSSTF